MEAAIKCPYCGDEPVLRAGNEVYGGEIGGKLAHRKFWCCDKCDARVGCHPGTDKPMGELADRKARAARMAAHAAFDPLWASGKMSRRRAYTRLAGYMRLDKSECHIAHFDPEKCAKVLVFVRMVEARDGRCYTKPPGHRRLYGAQL